jgi:hypothetical protein
VSERAPNPAAEPRNRAGQVASLANHALPRHQAVFIVAATVLAMAMLLGREDNARGPLWHAMWMLSLVVVLGSGLGAFARRLHSAPAAGRATPKGPAKPGPE